MFPLNPLPWMEGPIFLRLSVINNDIAISTIIDVHSCVTTSKGLPTSWERANTTEDLTEQRECIKTIQESIASQQSRIDQLQAINWIIWYIWLKNTFILPLMMIYNYNIGTLNCYWIAIGGFIKLIWELQTRPTVVKNFFSEHLSQRRDL